jgi:hypothetical protein
MVDKKWSVCLVQHPSNYGEVFEIRIVEGNKYIAGLGLYSTRPELEKAEATAKHIANAHNKPNG